MVTTRTRLPFEDDFRLPGEFEPIDCCWMLWPERPDNWRMGAKPAQRQLADIANAIAKHETVYMGVSCEQFNNARSMLDDSVSVVEISYNDTWVRDIGPVFLVDEAGRRSGVDWRFNAWGGVEQGLYFPWDKDDAVAHKLLELLRIPRYRAPYVLEGGGVMSDGQGTLLLTEESTLNPNRNNGLGKENMEQALQQYLGAQKIIWLPKGMVNDESDGQVSNFCAFARPGVIMLGWTDDTSDPQYERSKAALDILSREKDAQGRSFEIHTLPVPGPLYMQEDEANGVDGADRALPRFAGYRLSASYVGCCHCNTCVVFPLLDERFDSIAKKKLEELFPEKNVIGMPMRELCLGGAGGVHCVTLTVPRGISR